MRLRVVISLLFLFLLCWSVTFALQRRGRGSFLGIEESPAPMPPDAAEKTEFARARLRYPNARRRLGTYEREGNSWTIDYPKSDRLFLQGVRRLTRIHVKSVEQVVDLDSDDIFNYPFVYAVEVGHWALSDEQAAKLREYLLRGGFLMVDDFHGTYEWGVFMASMSRVFPERAVVEIENKDAIFHVLYDLDKRSQVPGLQYLYTGSMYEQDGIVPHWRGIYDDRGRVMVAICFNMDLGDAWEWADLPAYPEKWASEAYRVGINYIVYSMTH